MIIYKTTNLINSKIYIGQSRLNNNNYFGSGRKLKSAIKKYGKENFSCEILEKCKTKKELNKKEKYWIKKLNSQNNNIGYNIAKGGSSGNFHSDESKKKMSKLNLGSNNPMFGVRHSKEFKNKLSITMTGRLHSDETKQKISNSLIGIIRSDETKQKISKIHKNKILSEETKRKIGLANSKT